MHYQDMTIEASNATLMRTPDKQRVGAFGVRVLASPAVRSPGTVLSEEDRRETDRILARLERRIGVLAAVLTSWRAVMLNPGPMALWGALLPDAQQSQHALEAAGIYADFSRHLASADQRVLLAAADTFRAAAREQLMAVGIGLDHIGRVRAVEVVGDLQALAQAQ